MYFGKITIIQINKFKSVISYCQLIMFFLIFDEFDSKIGENLKITSICYLNTCDFIKVNECMILSSQYCFFQIFCFTEVRNKTKDNLKIKMSMAFWKPHYFLCYVS